MRAFLDTEVAGGLLLLAATAIALVWANSPLSDSYRSLWDTDLTVRVGGWSLSRDLLGWVNEGLMTLFFFVVGLEVKRELVHGELSTPRKAALPAIAALGGMVLPASIYLVLNVGGGGEHGWGIPMATDIAFALGVLALFGNRVHPALKVFLLSLAIADDVGAIVVIAIFYSSGIDLRALLVAGALIVVMTMARRANVRWLPIYAVLGTAVWLATLESGVHATIAGVVLGLLAPARPLREGPGSLPGPGGEDEGISASLARAIKLHVQEQVSVVERLENLLHPYTSFIVVPIFALANAGVALGAGDLRAAATSPITLGIVLGLVMGKLVGITSFAFVAHRVGIVQMPEGVTWSQLAAVASVAGIGFTVSLFVTSLAFDHPLLSAEAKVGILVGSLVASGLGALLIGRSAKRSLRAEHNSDAAR